MQNNILLKPVVSEKAFDGHEAGKYAFHVTKRANKKIVKDEVERLFKVNVEEVRIINIPGKVKRVGKIFGKRNDIKKAIVTVKKGQKIEEFKVK